MFPVGMGSVPFLNYPGKLKPEVFSKYNTAVSLLQ